MKYILHSTRRCPFCIRARIIMYLKGYDYEVIEEPMRQWTKWLQEWSATTGERARVPVLRYVDNDGTEHVLPESNDIDFFLDAADGNPEYTPSADSEGFTQMKKWWDWCDLEMKPVIDLYKYGENLVWDKEKNIGHTNELRTYLQTLEDYLQDHTYLVEERLTLADVAVIPFVRQIMRTRGGEFDFTDFPQVVTWANRVLETEWFTDIVMVKRPVAAAGE